MSLQEVLKTAEQKWKKTLTLVHQELGSIRTGRASVSVVDEIIVSYYNNPTPLKQMATLTAPQANLIVIQPWDPSVIADIEKAILKSNIGLTPANDGKLIRISIPPLTTEKRHEMVKIIKRITEEAKISIRVIRRDANETLEKEKKQSLLSEDEVFKGHEKIQSLTDDFISNIDKLYKEKETEIMQF